MRHHDPPRLGDRVAYRVHVLYVVYRQHYYYFNLFIITRMIVIYPRRDRREIDGFA